MRIWRLTISTKPKEGIDARMFCIQNNFIGVGWQVDQDAPMDWQTYYRLGNEMYRERGHEGWWPAVNAIRNKMENGDLCWTRDRNGNYYIGRIEGDWEYRSTDDYRNADVVNIRPCKWFRTGGVDSAPGKVLNSFRAPRAVQKVRDRAGTVTLYSQWKYNQLSGQNFCDVCEAAKRGVQLDLFPLISPEDCEDIVGIYLQEEYGYRLIPSTCKLDTPKTEFVLRNANGKAHVQVKQGPPLNRDNFSDYDPCDPCEWFLFTTSEQYTGGTHNHVHCLKLKDMYDFALRNLNLMSSRVQAFVEFLRSMGKI